MILIIIFTFIAIIILDAQVYQDMSMSYIMLKSVIVGGITFMWIMSGPYKEFADIIGLSVGAISVTFFVCLLVHLNIFILYKLRKLTYVSVVVSFTIGYVVVFGAIEYLKAI